MDNGKLTGVVFLDICKACDSISHFTLLDKMKMLGISGLEPSWFNSYLTNRQQQCLVDSQLSRAEEIICGVPQDFMLGPLLFLLYINDLPNCLQFATPCIYADDTQLSTSSHDSAELAKQLNVDLDKIFHWPSLNKLKPHSSHEN